MTRVSIVTPFLNAGPFIEESIESVLAQTFEDWELLLVDDGSTDASTGIALRYAAAHADKVRYLSHRGPAEPRRERLAKPRRPPRAWRIPRVSRRRRRLPAAEARGAGADSRRAPGRRDAVRGHGSIGTAGAGDREDAGRDWIWRSYGVKPNTVIEPPRMLVRFLEDGGTVPCMGSVLVRRAAIEDVGGWEESFRRICTDQVFHAKLCVNFPVMIVDVCLDRYRQHENSSCQTVARAGQLDAAFETYLTWLESYLAEQPIVDPTVRAAARRALRRHRHPWLNRVHRQALRYDARLRTLASRTVGRTLPGPLRRRLRGGER